MAARSTPRQTERACRPDPPREDAGRERRVDDGGGRSVRIVVARECSARGAPGSPSPRNSRRPPGASRLRASPRAGPGAPRRRCRSSCWCCRAAAASCRQSRSRRAAHAGGFRARRRTSALTGCRCISAGTVTCIVRSCSVLKPGIHMQHRDEAAQQQPAADRQRHGERDFRHDQRGPRAPPRTRGGRPRAVAKRVLRLRICGCERRDQPDADAGQDRQGQREQDDRQARRTLRRAEAGWLARRRECHEWRAPSRRYPRSRPRMTAPRFRRASAGSAGSVRRQARIESRGPGRARRRARAERSQR